MRKFGRRSFLSSMGLGAGAALLGPLFTGRLLPEAMGAVQPGNKRFILITHGGGLLEQHYTCPARSETDYDLLPVMKPFERWKSELLILSKFYCPHDKRQHGNQYAVLSMARSANQKYDDFQGKPPGGVSIDRFLGKQIGNKDPFDSTAVGLHEQAGNILTLSADGPGQEFPAIGSPVLAYDTYFARRIDPGGDAMKTAQLIADEKSVLDFIGNDVRRMQRRLAAGERAKLDQYLESLRGVERQLSQLVPSNTCNSVAKPAALLDKSNLDKDVIAAHVSVTHAAHLCNLTRVSHISIHGYSSPHNRYSWLGDSVGMHEAQHKVFLDLLGRIATYIYSVVAQMADLMANTVEGDTNMLHNGLLAFINVCGGKHHDGHNKYSVFTLGRAGGAVRPGRYVAYPEMERSLGDVWTGVSHAMGVKIPAFGDPAHCKGPLPALVG
jgi:hypothetical protein